MGAFLDKPKTEKETVSGDGYGGIKFGVSAMQGWRMEMEDAHVCQTKDFLKNCSIFGVFDGHAGPKAANYCAKNLVEVITKNYRSKGNEEGKLNEEPKEEEVRRAISKGFLRLDEELKEHLGDDRSGTTAVIAVVMPDKIIWGNCGDSRGLLCRGDKVEYATTDHKPYNEAERNRIEKAGGTVMMQRVNGSLAVSRALGDFDYKRNSQLGSTQQLVSPEPEIDTISRNHEEDAFLMLACDGIFDVMSNEDITAYILHQLKLKSDLETIGSDLIDLCLNKNSRDNMSVVLVTFPAAPKVSKEAIEKDKKMREKSIEEAKKRIEAMVRAAKDPLDVEEGLVMSELEKLFPEQGQGPYTMKEEILEFLEEERKKKFADKEQEERDFSGMSDPEYTPSSFGNQQSALPHLYEEMSSPQENKPDLLAHQTSDIPARGEDSESTTNNTIM